MNLINKIYEDMSEYIETYEELPACWYRPPGSRDLMMVRYSYSIELNSFCFEYNTPHFLKDDYLKYLNQIMCIIAFRHPKSTELIEIFRRPELLEKIKKTLNIQDIIEYFIEVDETMWVENRPQIYRSSQVHIIDE